jgi:hypothetical protein
MSSYNELFWSSDMKDLKKGYVESDQTGDVTCLLCGKVLEKGVIYQVEDQLLDAPRAMEEHIQQEHGSVFQSLLNMNKKITGLSPNQKEMLSLLYQGKSDNEIAKTMDIERSTVRNHRFKLREKQRQARITLALMEILDSCTDQKNKFLEIHRNAKMVDERYAITEEQQHRILKKYFIEGRLQRYPVKAKEEVVVLREAIKLFDHGKTYTEKEVNKILDSIFEDHAILRRNLVEYGFLSRKSDGSSYRMVL